MAENNCSNPNVDGNAGESQLPEIPLSKIFDNYKLSKYNTFIDSVIGTIFMQHVSDMGWTIDDLQEPSNLRRVYAGVKGELSNMLVDKYSDSGFKWKHLSTEVADDIDSIIENWEDFAREHLNFSEIAKAKNFNLNEDEIEDESSEGEFTDSAEDDDEEEENKGKEFDNEGNSKSQIELASNATRIMFRLLSEAKFNPDTKQADIVYDRDGLPRPANFIKVWNLLAERLQGEKDYGNFKAILLAEKTRQLIPEVDQINQMLKTEKPDSEKSMSETMQFLNFWHIFSKPVIPLQSSFFNREGSFSLSDEILGNRKKIELQWNNNFTSGKIPEEYKKYTKTSDTGVIVLKKLGDDDLYIPPIDGGYEARLKFLNFLGFQFTGLHLLNTTELENFTNLVNESAQRLHNSLKLRLDKGNQVKEPIKELRKRDEKIPSEFASIRDLIKFESEWSQITPTHSSRNAMGELQYLINLDSALSITSYHLNNSKTLDELMRTPSFINAKYNPQFRTSFVINYLFDEKGERRVDETTGNVIPRKVDLTLLSGFKEQQDNGRVITRLQRNLSERGKLIQDLNNFLSSGKTDIIRTETSFSFFSVGLSQDGVPFRYINPKGFTSDKDGFTKDRWFKNQILNYLNGELKRIASFDKKKLENPTLPDGYREFSIFSEISQPMKDRLKAVSSLSLDDELFKDFMNDYSRVLTKEFNAIKATINKNKISSDELLSNQLKDLDLSLNSLIRAFVAGTTIQNIEFSILYSGDPLFTGDKVLKRAKGMSSTGNIAADISLLSTFLQGEEEGNFHRKYSLAGANGKKARDNSQNFQTKTFIDPVSTNNTYTKPEFLEWLNASKKMRDGTEFSPQELQEIIKGGNAILSADGQGWINLDFHRELAMRHGFWTPNMEIAYKYEGLIYRRDIQGKELSVDEGKELERLTRKIFASPEKYSIPVLKLTYWGNELNSTVDAKAYDKFSVAPILPSNVRNKAQHKELMEDMIKGSYGYVKYQSGTKIFSQPAVNTLKGVEPDLYSTQLLKEQIKTRSEQKTYTSIPTQGLKMMFANLFNEGEPKTERAGKLYDKYKYVLKSIQREQRLKVLEDLGFDEKGEFSPTSLSNRLVREAKRQGLNSSIITSLSINPKTRNFNTDLESSGFQRQINGMIAGILDRSLRRFKFPGGDFVIVSNAGQPKLNWYRWTPEGTIPMEIRMNLTPEFAKLLNKVHPDGDRIGTIERLNRLIKNPEWSKENEKSLIVFIGRVPIQGPQSMGVGKVVEFLSPTSGNVIQESEESILQAGLDFDYDKRKIITPQFDAFGNHLSNEDAKNRMKKILDSLNELQDVYPELKRLADTNTDEEEPYSKFINKLFKTSSQEDLFRANHEADALLQEYKNIKEGVESIKSNSLLEIYKEALLLPEAFSELTSPTSTRNIKNLSLYNGDNTKTDMHLPVLGEVFSYIQNLKAKGIFFDAKNLLATFSTDNTWQQLMTYAGIDVNEKFNTTQWDRKTKSWMWKPGKINNLLLTAAETGKITKDGKILTSLRDDIEGFIKQHWNVEGMNATADAAKDPFIALLRTTFQNIGVVNVLRNFGVPFKRIVDFVNHPSLQYYFNLKNNGLSAAEALEDLAKNRLSLRYEVKSVPSRIYKEQYEDYQFLTTEQLIEKGMLNEDETFVVKQEGNDYTVQKTATHYPTASQIRRLFNEIDMGVPISDKNFTGDKALVDLSKYIKNNSITPERLEFLANPENDRLYVKELSSRKSENAQMYSDELRIVANFFALEKVGYAMMDFKKYFNFDTKKVSTLTDINVKKQLKNKILNQDLFSRSAFNKMEKSSILTAFINDEFIGDIYEKIFPILANKIVQNSLSELHNDYNTDFRTIKNKRDVRNLPFILSDDFLSSVVFNFSYVKGKKIFDYGLPLLIREGKTPTMADRLAEFKAKPYYAELARNFPALDNFISDKLLVDPRGANNSLLADPNGLPVPFVLENIQFLKDPQETLVEQEAIIKQFRDLYFHYVGDNAEEIKDFMKDLFITGIVQSGMSKTFISYQEYIPLEFKQGINDNAMSRWKALSPEDQKKFMNGFSYRFKANNPRYFPFIARKTLNNNKYWSKFKYYKIDTPPIAVPVEKAPEAAPVLPKVKIISGGQTGVDRLGLEVAKELGLETGGEAPKGYRTEEGKDLSLADFGLTESFSTGYTSRTKQNALNSDGTILFGDMSSAGSRETIKILKEASKPYIENPTADQIRDFIQGKAVINIAGNRASKLSAEQIQAFKTTLKEGLQKPNVEPKCD